MNYHDIAVSMLFVIVSYLVGSIPFGYIIGMFRGVDVRKHGSHNTGATNTLRLLGKTSGSLTFALDFAKGFFPVSLAFGYSHPLAYAVACAAIIGHCCSLYLSIKERHIVGGKAVTTTLGVAAVFIPYPTLVVALCVWGFVYIMTRYVSLASMVAAVTAALLDGLIDPNVGNKIFLVGAALLIFYKHRENVARLLSGTERKMGDAPKTDGGCCAFVIHPQQWEMLTRCFIGKILYWLWRTDILNSRMLFWIGVWFGPFLADDYIVQLDGGRSPIRTLIISTMFLPEHYQNKRYQTSIKQVLIKAARMAQRLGATTIGLGAYNSTFGEKGKWLQDYCDAKSIDLVVTNGGNYTAQGVNQIVENNPQRYSVGQRVAVIGAGGVVGRRIVTHLLRNTKCIVHAVNHSSDEFLHVTDTWKRRYPGRVEVFTTPKTPEEIARAKLRGIDVIFESLQRCNVCFTVTSDGGTVVGLDQVSILDGDTGKRFRKGPPLFIYDVSTTRDVDPLVATLDGVSVICFGAVIPPGNGPKFEIHGPAIDGVFPIPLCMAETILLAYLRDSVDGAYARLLASLNMPSTVHGQFLNRHAKEVGLANFVEF